VDELKARLKAVFDPESVQLGPSRAERIAMTEATRAFNAGVHAAAQALVNGGTPVVKQWLTRRDDRVREAHRDVNGQLRLLDDPFDVGGFPMAYPGDPLAPADLTVNCRCVMKATAAAREGNTDVSGDISAAVVEELRSKMPPKLKAYWLTGPGAAKILWGTPGSFTRCVAELKPHFPEDTEGLCANLYHEATGRWPGQQGGAQTGAMVALMPRAEDAARLALDHPYAEPPEELHTTLAFLGKAADWNEDARAQVRANVARAAAWLGPVTAQVFGAAHWNPQGDSPVWVWNVGDDHGFGGSRLGDVQSEVTWALEDRHGESPNMPHQHSPWVPHITAAYSPENLAGNLAERCGPVVFDRIRVAFAGEYQDFPLGNPAPEEAYAQDPVYLNEPPTTVAWSTPTPAALVFEDEQTGDSRVMAPGSLYWDGTGPWPLMANENFDGHDDASLVGAITSMAREGGRIAGSGVLYTNREEGYDAVVLLAQGAPLGVSVDLDNVDIEFVSLNGEGTPDEGSDGVYHARLLRASVLPTPDGGLILKGVVDNQRLSAGVTGSSVLELPWVSFVVGPDGRVPRSAFEIEAAAGESGAGGVVLDEQRCDDYLMRITRGRIRGATLVSVPAFAGARIVLDDPAALGGQPEAAVAASAWDDRKAPVTSSDYDRVLRHVRRSATPTGAARAAQFLKIPIKAVQRILAKAAGRGEVVRLTRGLYTDSTTSAKADHVMVDDLLASELVASVTGGVDLPVAARDTAWDGAAAESRVFDWADGDTEKIGRAFAWRDDSKDPATKTAYKLGYADVFNGVLTIVPRGVFAAQAAIEGARGGVDIPADELGAVRDRLAEVRAHVDEETGGEAMGEMQASAWAAMDKLPPMPAAWFREPTVEELPPGGPGVNYANGRIFGWVAQANVPHAGYAKRIVINDLGKIDTTEFLRQRKVLDDGTTVKVGAFTMNVGHHRDGAECETASCQFDDTRTVAGIITVGMNERGMWFSGAAAPWLSEWDRQVFDACQPSYHMKRDASGRWKLGAVLSVPVPGHPSALLASAVTERSQLALTAAATMAGVEEAVAAEKQRQEEPVPVDPVGLAELVAAAVDRALDAREARRAAELAELEELRRLGRTMGGTTVSEGN
jgi:2'-5' RNA ligase